MASIRQVTAHTLSKGNRVRSGSENLGPAEPDALGLEKLPPAEEFLVQGQDLSTALSCACGKV